mmetsp:Transcript_21154/g.43026  ORF Transcript_21154/g.43026 Transcript_21154/m.43026 type:complete len:682 (+) Transcript_21154:62-2107(+)
MASNLSSNVPAVATLAKACDRRSLAPLFSASKSCHGPVDFERSAPVTISKNQRAFKTVSSHIGGKENHSGNLKPLEIAQISKVLDTEAFENDLKSMEDELNTIKQQYQLTMKDLTVANETARKWEEEAREWKQKASELHTQLESAMNAFTVETSQLEDWRKLLNTLKESLRFENPFEREDKRKIHTAGENEQLIAEIESTKSERKGGAMAIDVESKLSNITDEKKSLAEELQRTKDDVFEAVTNLIDQVHILKSCLENAKTTIKDSLDQKQACVDRLESNERKFLGEIRLLNECRRNLHNPHNRVMQLSGNIRVFVRVRPLIPIEQKFPQDHASTSVPSLSLLASRPSSRGPHCDSLGNSAAMFQTISFPDEEAIDVTQPPKYLICGNKTWRYYFDRVFRPHHTQEDVWTSAEPFIQSAIDGFPVCMFAYGQTGSGKTHTMIGDKENPGLIPRAVDKLFNSKRDLEMNPGLRVSIKVELLEIYNEEVRDLLDSRSGPDGQLIKLKVNSDDTVGNILVSTDNKDEVSEILELAQKRRCVKATKSNSQSSRSHLLFTIHFEVDSDTESSRRKGCLRIVDLAGSERLEKSGSTGVLAKEAKHINSSLLALKEVISKLQAKEKHIPYRNSKLTYLLRDNLGGDSKTLAIVCCSPHVNHYHESSNSIRFAYDASKVELKNDRVFSA